MISVCMATYNGEKNIVRQIHSILIQLSNIDEIIVVDDCSTDNTIMKLNACADPRIHIYFNDKHLGNINKNFERAIGYAKGDIIFLSDQDDEWYSNKVSTIIDIFDNNENVFIIQHDVCVVDENKNVIYKSFNEYRNVGSGLIKNLIKSTYLGCAMCFKKDICTSFIPIPYPKYHDFWIGYLAELNGYSTLFLNDVLMDYYRYQSSSTGVELEHRKISCIILHRLNVLYNLAKYIFRKIYYL